MIDYNNIDNFYWSSNFPHGLRLAVCTLAKAMQASSNFSEAQVAQFFINKIKKATDNINNQIPNSVEFVNPFGLPDDQIPVFDGGGGNGGGSQIPGQIIDGVLQILKPQHPIQGGGGQQTGNGSNSTPTIGGFKLSSIIIIAVVAKLLKIW